MPRLRCVEQWQDPMNKTVYEPGQEYEVTCQESMYLRTMAPGRFVIVGVGLREARTLNKAILHARGDKQEGDGEQGQGG
jgi:hypothetical protein